MKTAFQCLTTLLFSLAISAQCAAQSLDFLVSDPIPDPDAKRVAAGMDAERFYLLRVIPDGGDDFAHLEGWSRPTLLREFDKPLQVPVVNAEEFKVCGFAVQPNTIRVFYSFYSKADDKLVFAMAPFSAQGEPQGDAVQLDERSGSKERKAGYYTVRHDVEAGRTLLAYQRAAWGMFEGCSNPDIWLACMEPDGRLSFAKDLNLGKQKCYYMQDAMTDRTGNIYLKLADNTISERPDGEPCAHKVFTVNVATSATASHCAPELEKRVVYKDRARFVRDEMGAVHFAAAYGHMSEYRLEGIQFASFDPSSAELLKDKAYHFTAYHPKDVKHSDKDPKFMSAAAVLGYAVTPTGHLRIYGEEYLANNTMAQAGELSYWGLELDPATGIGKPWVCEAKRKYAMTGVPANSFLDHVVRLQGKDYLLTNDMPVNLGKACGALEPWGGTGFMEQMAAAYMPLDPGPDFGTRGAVSASPVEERWWLPFTARPNEEHIMRLFNRNSMRWVRVRAK